VKHEAGDDDRIAALEEARDALLDAGDRERAALTEGLLAEAWWSAGSSGEVLEHLARGLELVEDLPPSVAGATVIARAARYLTLAGRTDEGLELTKRALAAADELRADEVRVHALNTQGVVYLMRDDERAMAPLAEAVELAERTNSPQFPAVVNNLSVARLGEDLAAVIESNERSREAALRLGQRANVRFQDGLRIANAWFAGDWPTSSRLADEFIRECETGSPHYHESLARGIRALLRLSIGQAAGALSEARHAVELARVVQNPQALAPALAHLVIVLTELGQVEQAKPLAAEAVEVAGTIPFWPVHLELAWFAAEVGIRELERARVESLRATPWRDGMLSVLDGDYERGANAYELGGASGAAARARLYGAEAAAHSDPALARRLADPAARFFREVTATAYLRRIEALLPVSA
jgi:tetratricopeptide (TPR) repeat protein